MEISVNVGKLFEAPGIDRLGEAAFFDALFGGNIFAGKIIFIENLKKLLCR